MLAALQMNVAQQSSEPWVVQQSSDPWTELNTLATFLAVAVALFGPFAFEHLRRPRITASAVHEAYELAQSVARGPLRRTGPRLVVDIANQGRRQAEDVQVFLSMGTMTGASDPDRPRHRVVALQTPVGFIYEKRSRSTYHESVAIPPGFAKPLVLLSPSDEGLIFRLPGLTKPPVENGDYQVTLDIVGSNFKVVRYEGRVKITGSQEQGDHRIEWVKPLQSARYAPGNPLGAWIKASA